MQNYTVKIITNAQVLGECRANQHSLQKIAKQLKYKSLVQHPQNHMYNYSNSKTRRRLSARLNIFFKRFNILDQNHSGLIQNCGTKDAITTFFSTLYKKYTSHFHILSQCQSVEIANYISLISDLWTRYNLFSIHSMLISKMCHPNCKYEKIITWSYLDNMFSQKICIIHYHEECMFSAIERKNINVWMIFKKMDIPTIATKIQNQSFPWNLRFGGKLMILEFKEW